MKVPFLALDTAPPALQDEIRDSVERVIQSSQFVLGNEVRAFEQEWAAYCGARFCVGVGNGLDALQLCLIAAGVERGDEVLVPSSTFIATWFAVSNIGAVPVGLPVREDGRNIDVSQIARFITPKTKAIVPVHLYGQPADIDEILEISALNRLVVIEDAAQAHGAEYKGRMIGSHGDLSAWSFYPGKNLGAYGDGGAITTNNEILAEKLRLLRNYGSSKKYHHEIVGFNSRLDELQAAILRVKLKHLDVWNHRRLEIARSYTSRLRQALSQYKSQITFPAEIPDTKSSWHLYVVNCKARDELVEKLRASGIEILLHYPVEPLFQPAYETYRASLGNPRSTQRTMKGVFSLPIGPHLNENQVDFVIDSLIRAAHEVMGKT